MYFSFWFDSQHLKNISYNSNNLCAQYIVELYHPVYLHLVPAGSEYAELNMWCSQAITNISTSNGEFIINYRNERVMHMDTVYVYVVHGLVNAVPTAEPCDRSRDSQFRVRQSIRAPREK